jgi:hypothetical protein
MLSAITRQSRQPFHNDRQRWGIFFAFFRKLTTFFIAFFMQKERETNPNQGAL